MYVVFRPLGRWVFRMWHRIELDGLHHLDDPTALQQKPARILYSGHQNALADPVFSCVSLPKQMHYFTRADVFANPLARAILLRINMMPIFRPVDHAPQMVERNQDTFNAAHARLSAGATLGIFPEAGHLDERRTRRFRHGSARLILGAMRKAALQQRGMHVQPVVMDFERYEGYRTHARLRIGAPLELNRFWDNSEDGGGQRIALSHQMREALVHLSVELTEGTLYDPHLAICRYMEGYHAGRPHSGVLQNIEARLKQDEDNALSEFRDLLAKGMPHPRLGDAFSALGRLHRQGETPWWKEAWRWPAWVIFITTTGWWPMWIEARMAKQIKDPAYRTTFGIPLLLVCVSVTWGLMALAVGLLSHNPILGLSTLVGLRFAQALAMPFEDRRLDRRNERLARPFSTHPWVVKWCHLQVNAAGRSQTT
jgi:1-acyl-sn-glycerol-3-phosphate acyltransferase